MVGRIPVQRLLDATAVSLSGLCFVHCLILPFAAAALPLLSLFADAGWVHWVFVGMAAPIAAFAVGPLVRHEPHAWGIPALALAGVALLIAGACDYPTHLWGTAVTVAGGATLAGAHLLNRRRAIRAHRR